MAELNIKERPAGKVMILDLEGVITISETDALRSAVYAIVGEEKTSVILNLRKVSFTDSQGVGELVFLNLYLNEDEGGLALLNISGVEVDNGTMLPDFLKRLTVKFAVYEDETEAINSFNQLEDTADED